MDKILMNFKELMEAMKKVKWRETRHEEENFIEAVIARETEVSLRAILENYFGPPFKPEGKRASISAEIYAEAYGGIQSNQTLYLCDKGSSREMAFLWPWGNGTAVTVKIVRTASKPPAKPGRFASFIRFVRRIIGLR